MYLNGFKKNRHISGGLNDSNNLQHLELLEKRYFTDQLSVHLNRIKRIGLNIIKDQVNER